MTFIDSRNMSIVQQKGTKNFILRDILAGFLIWSVFPFVLTTDIVVEIYHRIAFPIYGIPLVKRSNYIRVFDRAKLRQLNFMEKVSCAYCGYVNGWAHYISEIAGRTEEYFCPIKHANDNEYIPAQHESKFMPYEKYTS